MGIYDNRLIDWSQLIRISDKGLVVESYPDIKKAIIAKYKDIYGNDIDISTNSADGIYLEFYSLMINNILQNFSILHSNLNINNASGYYLDILASLKNVKRKPATKSMASITITNNTASEYTISKGNKFLDINGQTWTYQAESIIKYVPNIPLADGESASIIVFADNYGPISCYSGTINSLLEFNSDIEVEQTQDGVMGSFEETDSQLKTRCDRSSGIKSKTMISNIESNLLSILGIEDCKVYNNPVSKLLNDGTSCSAHTIYAVIKKAEGLVIDDMNIGEVIYNSSTPGIPTQNPIVNVKAGESKNITISQVDDSGNEIPGTEEIIHWKEAKAINCEIQFTITNLPNFSDDTLTEIVNSCKDYLNNLNIGENINENELINAIIYSDPYFMGRRTFTLGDITYKDSEGGGSSFTQTVPTNYNSFYKFEGEIDNLTITLISGEQE